MSGRKIGDLFTLEERILLEELFTRERDRLGKAKEEAPLSNKGTDGFYYNQKDLKLSDLRLKILHWGEIPKE